MMKVNRFHFKSDWLDDILLLPSILENTNQIKQIIEIAITNLHQAVDRNYEYMYTLIRKSCSNLVLVNWDNINNQNVGETKTNNVIDFRFYYCQFSNIF